MNEDLDSLDANGLRRRFVEMVLLKEETDHIGRENRISGWVHEIGERLIAIGSASAREAMPLLEHRSGAVRFAIAYFIKPFNRELFNKVVESLAGDHTGIGRDARFALSRLEEEEERAPTESVAAPAPDPEWLRIINWPKDNPPPAAMSRAHFEDRVQTGFSADRAAQILSLARPAIDLWPQREMTSDNPLASRHGGDVWAPPGWQWPIYEEEPMYFLGQIHCPDLVGLPGAQLLPREGLLAFFGDFDLISGCFPGGGAEQGAVCHWPTEGLIPTAPPLPLDTRESAAIPLVFRPFIDLPDIFSALVEELALSDEERERYDNIRRAARHYGIPDEVSRHTDFTDKLLGWPDLVQPGYDLPDDDAYRLLVQLPARMGPGGSLYFFITDEDLAQRRFDRCILDEQNT